VGRWKDGVVGKKAQEYLRSRQKSLSKHDKKFTDLAGVDEETMESNMRHQALADEEDHYVRQGLVPVAIDFAQNAKKCGVPYEKDSGDVGSYFWVPAWYLAAWYSYKERFGEPNIMNAPTTAYKEFIKGLIDNVDEQILLVGEAALSTPHRGKATIDGTRVWIELHT